MRPLPTAPVFTAANAYADGWTPAALRHAVRTGRLLRLRPGVYARPTADTPADHAVAAALRYPNAVVSHRSAALLHRLPVVGGDPLRPEVTVPPRANGNLTAVHLYRARLRTADVTLLRDVPVTAAARTVVDVARHRQRATAVALADAALHSGRCDVDELDRVLRDCWNWPRIARAQRALRLVDGRAESPLESISRLTIVGLGLPGPAIQPWIFDADGRAVGRVDFYWDEYGVVGEADGRDKYDDRSVLTSEKDRQERLEELGLVVVRWGWFEATRGHRLLADRLGHAFERGRRRDRSGFPRLWSL